MLVQAPKAAKNRQDKMRGRQESCLPGWPSGMRAHDNNKQYDRCPQKNKQNGKRSRIITSLDSYPASETSNDEILRRIPTSRFFALQLRALRLNCALNLLAEENYTWELQLTPREDPLLLASTRLHVAHEALISESFNLSPTTSSHLVFTLGKNIREFGVRLFLHVGRLEIAECPVSSRQCVCPAVSTMTACALGLVRSFRGSLCANRRHERERQNQREKPLCTCICDLFHHSLSPLHEFANNVGIQGASHSDIPSAPQPPQEIILHSENMLVFRTHTGTRTSHCCHRSSATGWPPTRTGWCSLPG